MMFVAVVLIVPGPVLFIPALPAMGTANNCPLVVLPHALVLAMLWRISALPVSVNELVVLPAGRTNE